MGLLALKRKVTQHQSWGDPVIAQRWVESMSGIEGDRAKNKSILRSRLAGGFAQIIESIVGETN